MPPAGAARENAGPRRIADELDLVERGRRAYARRAWAEAHHLLSAADEAERLGAGDLELLATSAGMTGRDEEYVSVLERAHYAHLESGATLRAVRCAFWVGTWSMVRGELSRATGWLGRAQRILDREEGDVVERGYLLIVPITALAQVGDFDAACAIAQEGAGIGERFGDTDLVALALHEQGRLRITQGRVDEGLALLDEVMVSVGSGRLSPMLTGLLYCSVIEGCRQTYELRRAREWTTALTRWCEQQPELVTFTGRCLVHRAEILQVEGAWPDALEEARRAGQRFAAALNRPAAGEAVYREGEIRRLRGEWAAAEQAYREAGRHGWEPQPGLALLRLAQGDRSAAVSAIRRIVAECSDPLERAGLLPAAVEILVAAGELDEARRASRQLDESAARFAGGMLSAMASHARGAVALAGGDDEAALVALRAACQSWLELGAPHEAARARVLVGLACRGLGDADAAEMELDAARRVFVELGAAPDLAWVGELSGRRAAGHADGLTAREVEVVRLVATGMTNRAIAEELVISEKTVARHVSNVFTKLEVASRSAVTAYAYEHGLL